MQGVTCGGGSFTRRSPPWEPHTLLRRRLAIESQRRPPFFSTSILCKHNIHPPRGRTRTPHPLNTAPAPVCRTSGGLCYGDRMLLRLAYGGAPRPPLPANAPPLARAYALVMSDRAKDGEQQTSGKLSSSRSFKWGGDTAELEALRLPTGVKAAERLMDPVSPPRAQWFEQEGPSSDPAEMRRRIDDDTQRRSSEWTRLWAVCAVIALAIVGADNMLPPGG